MTIEERKPIFMLCVKHILLNSVVMRYGQTKAVCQPDATNLASFSSGFTNLFHLFT